MCWGRSDIRTDVYRYQFLFLHLTELIFTVHSLQYCMHLRLTFLLFDFWWLPHSHRPDCVAQAPMLPTPTPKITTDDHLESWRTPWKLKFNGWNLKSWRIMEVWKIIFLFNLVIFRWSILIFRCFFRIPILSLAFVVQPFELWDQGQSVVSPWLPCGSYVAGQTEGLCTRCFGERRGNHGFCGKSKAWEKPSMVFFLWKLTLPKNQTYI